MPKLVLLSLFLFFNSFSESEYFLPVSTASRKSVEAIQLTDIGAFGLMRKARKDVPAHYHTGIDIKRTSKNYKNEPVFPMMEGEVISKRDDGPYAQLILEHEEGGKTIWTVYEHIAGITVNLHEHVKPSSPIARFMNTTELNKYGWQFDHLHFEVLKAEPVKLQPGKTNPDRRYSSYTLVCFTEKDLNKYFYEPAAFLKEKL